jgi:hypothetical protein
MGRARLQPLIDMPDAEPAQQKQRGKVNRVEATDLEQRDDGGAERWRATVFHLSGNRVSQ